MFECAWCGMRFFSDGEGVKSYNDISGYFSLMETINLDEYVSFLNKDDEKKI